MSALRSIPSTLRRVHHLATLASPSAEIAGVGLHSGAFARVRLHPAAGSDGISFVRSDLPGSPPIAARPSSVVSTVLSTAIGAGEASVSTIEHLMSALCGLGVRACRIEVDSPELPLLDGSAAPWVRAIESAGVVPLRPDATVSAPTPLTAPVRVEEGESWAIAIPARQLRLTVGIEFGGHAPIGRQWASWSPHDLPAISLRGADDAERARDATMRLSPSGAASRAATARETAGRSFAAAIAPARTFALAEQVEALREAGLIRGGTLENALVCDTARWLNGPLRFSNEPARHKLLDLLGDLALLGGGPPAAHVVAWRASHELHVRLARAIEAATMSARLDKEPHGRAAGAVGGSAVASGRGCPVLRGPPLPGHAEPCALGTHGVGCGKSRGHAGRCDRKRAVGDVT